MSRPLKAKAHVLPSNILFINNRINNDLTDFLQLAQGGLTNELFVKKIYIYSIFCAAISGGGALKLC